MHRESKTVTQVQSYCVIICHAGVIKAIGWHDWLNWTLFPLVSQVKIKMPFKSKKLHLFKLGLFSWFPDTIPDLTLPALCDSQGGKRWGAADHLNASSSRSLACWQHGKSRVSSACCHLICPPQLILLTERKHEVQHQQFEPVIWFSFF